MGPPEHIMDIIIARGIEVAMTMCFGQAARGPEKREIMKAVSHAVDQGFP